MFPAISLDRLQFIPPDRTGSSNRYAHLRHNGTSTQVAYTEASRGCKHTCRHCPIVPVYGGQFRVVQREVVLEDIRRQVEQGAAHVTFGDPDFFNGPTHAMKIVEAMHAEFPASPTTSSSKSSTCWRSVICSQPCGNRLPDGDQRGRIAGRPGPSKLEKHHTRQDFFEAVDLVAQSGLTLQPTFIAFTPWTTLESYQDLLRSLAALELMENVAPVQLALRLLITQGSLLLDLEDIQASIGAFDAKSLIYPWRHRDPAIDVLGHQIF